jgi:sulfonate transport system ATP-binding protein
MSHQFSDARAPALRVRDVRRAFDGRQVLGGIDLDVGRGEFIALLGPSGCGKSTLLRVLAGLDPHATGTFGVPVRTSVVFQEPRLLPWKKVWQNVALGLPFPAAQRRERALALLEEVRLSHRAEAWPLTLSGGEAQRAALARALVRDPELLLLDEPFGALDALTRMRMHGLLAQLWRRHEPAVLLVTHDVDEALLLAHRVIVLSSLAPSAQLLGDTSSGRLGNTIVAELEVDIPAPRRRGHARFEALRTLLLRHLGVKDEEGVAPPSDYSAELASAQVGPRPQDARATDNWIARSSIPSSGPR